MKIEKEQMKSAYIDQMLMWTLFFVTFTWLFFFVLNYSTAVRLNENMDYISKFAAKYVSNMNDQNTVSTDTTLITALNAMKLSKIGPISGNDISCNIAASAPQNVNSQSIFITQGTYLKGFLSGQGSNNLVSRAVVYNQTSVAQITCTLSVSIN